MLFKKSNIKNAFNKSIGKTYYLVFLGLVISSEPEMMVRVAKRNQKLLFDISHNYEDNLIF